MHDDDGNAHPTGGDTTFHVGRAMGGDLASLDWVVRRLAPLLEAHAEFRLGALRRTCEPVELVQEAWLVALPRLPELASRADRCTPVLLAFLTTTIVQRIYNLAKKQARERERLDDVGVSKVAADVSGVVTHALRRERRDSVRTALDELSPDDRQVILLRGIEQQPTKTASVVLGISEDAVSKRYRRALQRLRDRLPGSVFDELEG